MGPSARRCPFRGHSPFPAPHPRLTSSTGRAPPCPVASVPPVVASTVPPLTAYSRPLDHPDPRSPLCSACDHKLVRKPLHSPKPGTQPPAFAWVIVGASHRSLGVAVHHRRLGVGEARTRVLYHDLHGILPAVQLHPTGPRELDGVGDELAYDDPDLGARLPAHSDLRSSIHRASRRPDPVRVVTHHEGIQELAEAGQHTGADRRTPHPINPPAQPGTWHRRAAARVPKGRRGQPPPG